MRIHQNGRLKIIAAIRIRYFDGLNIVANKNISKGEELTLDYALFLDENMEPFECSCGSPNCRVLIKGIKNISVTKKEQAKKVKERYSSTAPYTPSISGRR